MQKTHMINTKLMEEAEKRAERAKKYAKVFPNLVSPNSP